MATKTKDKPSNPSRTRYEDDLYSWMQEQVALLRAGRLSEVDVLDVAGELPDVGRDPFEKLESAVAVLAMHLLKWDFQSERRSRSWQSSINERCRHIARHQEKSGFEVGLGRGPRRGLCGRARSRRWRNGSRICGVSGSLPLFEEVTTRKIVHEPATTAGRGKR